MSPPEFIMAMTLIGSGVALVFYFAMPARKAMLRKIEGSAQTFNVLDVDKRVKSHQVHTNSPERRLQNPIGRGL